MGDWSGVTIPPACSPTTLWQEPVKYGDVMDLLPIRPLPSIRRSLAKHAGPGGVRMAFQSKARPPVEDIWPSNEEIDKEDDTLSSTESPPSWGKNPRELPKIRIAEK